MQEDKRYVRIVLEGEATENVFGDLVIGSNCIKPTDGHVKSVEDIPRPKPINAGEAVELLLNAVQDQGEDYIYPRAGSGQGCVYAEPDGAPSCLVGHALSKAGVKIEGLSGSAISLAKHHDLPLTPGASKVFQMAQILQDKGSKWGDAFRAAEALLDYEIVKPYE